MYQETAADLERKWVGSYCRYDSGIVYCGGFGQNAPAGPIIGSFQLVGGSTTTVPQIYPHLFAPIEFPNGLYNIPFSLQDDFDSRYRVGCWKYHRNPRRSPMRGITRDTHRWISMGQRLFPAEGHLHWSFDLLDVVLNPRYVNYHHAFEAVKEFKIAAIDTGWAVGLSPIKDTDGRHLFMSMYGFCGWAYPDRIVIHHRGSYQEALDFVQRSRLDIPVIYAE